MMDDEELDLALARPRRNAQKDAPIDDCTPNDRSHRRFAAITCLLLALSRLSMLRPVRWFAHWFAHVAGKRRAQRPDDDHTDA